MHPPATSIPFNGIETITNGKVIKYEDGKVEVATNEGSQIISCDSVVLAVGYQENKGLFEELQFEIPESYLLGDARKVANIMYGIWDACQMAHVFFVFGHPTYYLTIKKFNN